MSAAPTAPLVTEEEYLRTSYEPDREFVDGALVRRNVGSQRHSHLVYLIAMALGQSASSGRYRVFPDVRLRVSHQPTRYRIPDILLLGIPYQRGQVIVDVPLAVIEVKSPEDTLDSILDKGSEYQALGVPVILVLDPERKMAWSYRDGELTRFAGNSLDLADRGSVPFPIQDLFAELDR